MMLLGGKPVPHQLLDHLSKSTRLDEVVVTTTELKEEAIIFAPSVNVFRGSTGDVLDRYYRAARKFGADVIVRITP